MSFNLRKHQIETDDFLKRHISGEQKIPGLLLEVTPGGGKSFIPLIALVRLKAANLADKLCWVVPRTNLQSQGAENFTDEVMR